MADIQLQIDVFLGNLLHDNVYVYLDRYSGALIKLFSYKRLEGM